MKLIFVFLTLAISMSITAQKKLPDLVVKEIYPPEDPAEGTSFRVLIKNIGKVTSEPVKAKLYDLDLSLEEAIKLGIKKEQYWIFEENTSNAQNGIGNKEDITLYDNDKYVENIQLIPALIPNQTIEIIFIIKDYWIFDYNCEVEVFVDFDNQLKERNENNNKKQFFAGG